MIGKARQQVSPKVTAAVILTVLVIIQILWWRGLVMKPKPGPSGEMHASGGPPAGPPTLLGRQDVKVNTFAGAPEPGDSDGPGYDARFDGPVGLAFDAQGNLIVADSRNHRIRRITPHGVTSTVAGSGPGYADGPVAQAKFNLPCGVAVGPEGAIYVADSGNNRIRRIQDGQVTTLAGSVPGLADGEGTAVRFHAPCALAVGEGAVPTLLVADSLNHRIRILSLSGKITGGWEVPGVPTAILADAKPTAAVPTAGIAVSGGPTLRDIPIETPELSVPLGTFALHHPLGLCPAPNGWFVTDSGHCGVFYVHDGKAELLAGRCQPAFRLSGWSDNVGNRARLGQVSGVVSDKRGHIYVCDTSNNTIRRLTLPGELMERKEAHR